jgi:hypothetical protein
MREVVVSESEHHREDPYLLKRLQATAAQRWGNPVLTAGDCDALAQDVLAATGICLSRDTLRRLFGLVRYASKPNAFTLNALALYAGHESYYAFVRWVHHRDGIQIRITPFYVTWKVCRVLSQALRQQPELRPVLYPVLAQTQGFFQHWPDMDYRSICHAQGLRVFAAANPDPDSQTLAYGWLALEALLTNNQDALATCAQKL